jgi:UDP-glucuronate 4-epimerase
MSRYIVTGAAGFIASRVSEILLRQGHTIIGIDNMNDSYDVRLKDWRLAQLVSYPNFIFLQEDISQFSKIEKVFNTQRQIDAVINLAARAGVRMSVENPWAYLETNVNGTLNLLELCQRYEIQKFILASTSSLYGSHNPVPYHEDTDTNRPLSPYAASKKAAEALCHSYHHLYQLDVTVFRYFTVYGPAGRPDMSLFRFTQWISEGYPVQVYGDGYQSRDFTFVDDIARGTIAGLKNVKYQVINLGNDQPHPLMEVIHLLEDYLGKKANIVYSPMHKADVYTTRASIDKARNILDWKPEVSLEEGLKKLVDWYEKERSWARYIATP